MPFSGQIPALFLEGASGSSVLEVFARNLFANLDTGEVYLRSGDRSPILLWPAKRGDQIPVQIRFVNEELDGADELIALPEGWGITVEGHLVVGGVAQYGGPVMIRQTVWAEEDPGTDPHYDAVIDFETVGINAAIGKGTGAELPYIDIELDIEVTVGGQKLSSMNLKCRVYNDHARGESETPAQLGYIGNGLQHGFWITGLTGGASTDLDGQPTAHLEYGRPLVIVDVGEGPPSLYKYIEDPDPGVTACDGVNLIKPADYDSEDNRGLWSLRE